MPTAYGSALTAAQIAALYAGTYAGSETLKVTRTNSSTALGTAWYDDGTAPDGTFGTVGAAPTWIGLYGVPPVAYQTVP